MARRSVPLIRIDPPEETIPYDTGVPTVPAGLPVPTVLAGPPGGPLQHEPPMDLTMSSRKEYQPTEGNPWMELRKMSNISIGTRLQTAGVDSDVENPAEATDMEHSDDHVTMSTFGHSSNRNQLQEQLPVACPMTSSQRRHSSAYEYTSTQCQSSTEFYDKQYAGAPYQHSKCTSKCTEVTKCIALTIVGPPGPPTISIPAPEMLSEAHGSGYSQIPTSSCFSSHRPPLRPSSHGFPSLPTPRPLSKVTYLALVKMYSCVSQITYINAISL